ADDLRGVAPVEHLPQDAAKKPQKGIGLCLSGGGYRAMLFHLGALWHLNELGYLPKSVTAGVLGMNCKHLRFDPKAGVSPSFTQVVVAPIRRLASVTIDQWAIIGGIVTPGATISDKVAGAYRKYLFHDATLQDLPDDPPRFIFNATNVQSRALWRFSKPYMA